MKQLRILGLGDYANYYSYFTYGIMEGAIRAGAWFRPVHLFQSLDDVKKQVDFFKPHIILAHCIFNRRPHDRGKVFELLHDFRKDYGSKIYYHMGDARSEPRYPYNISHFCDGALVNNLELEKWSKIWGVPCMHWPYMALQQKEINQPDDRFFADVVFTGSLGGGSHHAKRTEFLEKLKKKGIQIKTYPDPVWGNSRFLTADVASSSSIILGTQMGGDIKGYVDVRPWQYIGAGALYFHEKHSNMDYYFKHREHYVMFDGVEDFIDKAEWYVQNPRAAGYIRKSGFDYCQKWHSTLSRMKSILIFYRLEDIWYPIELKDIERHINESI